MAVAYNVVIDQGADWFLNVNYDNPDGTPVNLAGYSSALQVRSLPTSPTAVLSLTSAAGGGITITAQTGLVAIHATADQTRAIDEGTYYYDLENDEIDIPRIQTNCHKWRAQEYCDF